MEHPPKRNASLASLFFIAVPVVLFSLILVFFIRSGAFAIQNVTVQGVKLSAESEILKLSEDIQGQNLFLFDQELLKHKITLHPFIKNVQFQRKPPHTLDIAVTEREPAALVAVPHAVLEVDVEGTFLRRLESWPKTDHPVISGIEQEDMVGPGQTFTNPFLTDALALLREAPPELAGQIGELHVDTSRQMTLYLTNGIEVRLGQNDDWKSKLNALNELINSADYQTFEQGVRYIDFTATKPVVGR